LKKTKQKEKRLLEKEEQISILVRFLLLLF